MDTAAPTVTFAPATGATAGPATNVTVTFTEAVRNLDNGDITDTNAHLTVELKKSDGTGADLAGSGQVSIDDANKVITIDPAADLAAGDYTVKLLANKVEDVADNAVVAASATFTVDASVPGVTFTPADGTTTGDVNVNVLVQFDEPVRQADGNALTAAAATAALTLVRVGDGSSTDLAGAGRVSINNDKTVITINPAAALVSGASYTVTLPANTVEDEQGNEHRQSSSRATFTVDTAAPTVTFVPADGTKTGDVDTDVLVQFDEPVRQADGNALTAAAATAALTLVRVGDGSSTDLAGAGRVSINNDKTVITIDPAAALVSGASYTVTLPANTVEDEQGNEIDSDQSATFTVDTAAPTVTITGVPAYVTDTTAFTATFTFDKAVVRFEATNVSVTNATTVNFTTTSTREYTLEVTPDGTGDVTVTVAQDAATDADGNDGPAAAVSERAVWDDTPPGLTIALAPAAFNAADDAIAATFTFDEPVTGFDIADVTVTGGTRPLALTPVTGQGNTDRVWRGTFTTTGDAGDLTVAVEAGRVQDTAGNAGPAADVSAVAARDTAAPTLTVVTGEVGTDGAVTFKLQDSTPAAVTLTVTQLSALVPANTAVVLTAAAASRSTVVVIKTVSAPADPPTSFRLGATVVDISGIVLAPARRQRCVCRVMTARG